jgi:GNAT superfamily N-acetyltransferase
MIRMATVEDKEAILKLISEFYEEELKQRGVTFDYTKASQDFDLVVKFECFVGLLIDNNGIVDGFLGALITPRFFFVGMAAQELMWYVRKGNRKEGIRLLKVFEQLCVDRGCKDIMMIGLSGTKAEMFYEHFGYTKLETTYTKPIGEKNDSNLNIDSLRSGSRNCRWSSIL